MIKSGIEKHTVGWLHKQSKKNALDFNVSIQRKDVWNLEHRSNLIASVLMNIPIENLLYEENSDGYYVLDGKQRSLTFIRFINNEFAISDKVKVKTIKGHDIVGKTFDELPEELREDLLDYELSISTLRPLSEEEREVVFFMRNQAVALSKIELTRVLAGSDILKTLEHLCQHPFIADKFGITTASKNKYTDLQLILILLNLENGFKYDLSGAGLMGLSSELRENGIPSDMIERIKNHLDYLDSAYDKKIKFFKKVNLPAIYMVSSYAFEEGISPSDFNDKMVKVIETITKEGSEYSILCSNATNAKSNVSRRIEIMLKTFKRA